MAASMMTSMNLARPIGVPAMRRNARAVRSASSRMVVRAEPGNKVETNNGEPALVCCGGKVGVVAQKNNTMPQRSFDAWRSFDAAAQLPLTHPSGKDARLQRCIPA